jgi:hypothetical protein
MWPPSLRRAALTRLRQAGHVLEKSKAETGATVYRIAVPAHDGRSVYRVATSEDDKAAKKTRTGQRRGGAKPEAQAAH